MTFLTYVLHKDIKSMLSSQSKSLRINIEEVFSKAQPHCHQCS